jgi:energy-coupling factor transporter ATP-binding protein EcfA2
MKHLIIHNVGPIKEVDIELKRFNFIIGPQSSGKSTVAKILSTCEWIEKEVETTRNEHAIGNGENYRTLVEGFHKMEDYFDQGKESFVSYSTDFIEICYEHREFNVHLKREVPYHRQKICYIPAERNMVTLPELKGFEFSTTNLRSFLFDWYRAREYYSPQNKTNVLGLGVQYYYDAEMATKNDRIQHVNGQTYDISLSNSSSGLQSLTPLLVMLQYYTDQYFQEYDFKNSFEQNSKSKQLRLALTREVALSQYKPDFKEEEVAQLVKQFNEALHRHDKQAEEIFRSYEEACDRLLIPNRTTFIIEEPEQNLYPFTQVALIEAVIKLCSNGRKHGCTITTHSPFVLNYLNVLIARYYKNVADAVKLDPMELGVFGTNDGRLSDLMQYNPKTGENSVNAEDLVEAMRDMYTQYRQIREM